jgi:hypothetical protein
MASGVTSTESDDPPQATPTIATVNRFKHNFSLLPRVVRLVPCPRFMNLLSPIDNCVGMGVVRGHCTIAAATPEGGLALPEEFTVRTAT